MMVQVRTEVRNRTLAPLLEYGYRFLWVRVQVRVEAKVPQGYLCHTPSPIEVQTTVQFLKSNSVSWVVLCQFVIVAQC